MHARAGQDRHFTVGGGRLALLMGLALLAAAMFGAGMQRLLFGASASPYTVDWPSYARSQSNRDADFLRENVNMLATKVGMLQAKLVSIDGLGRRVAEIAGLQYTGGDAAVPATLQEATHVMDDLFTDRQPPTPESAEALGRQLDDIQTRMAEQADNLKLLDAALTSHSAEQARVPTAMPIKEYPYLSSSYGWRRNPVTGRYAMHEGLDFSAPPGTPILAPPAAWCCWPRASPATAIWSRSIMAMAWSPATPTLRVCWSRPAMWSSAARKSPVSAHRAAPPGRTCTSRCAWRASRWIRASSSDRRIPSRPSWPRPRRQGRGHPRRALICSAAFAAALQCVKLDCFLAGAPA